MKTIEVDEDLYRYIAMQTQDIGESASDILRRLLLGEKDAGSGDRAVAEQAVAPTADKDKAQQDVFAHLDRVGVVRQKRTVDRFLTILAAMARFNPERFPKVLELRGRNRVYFATSKEQLLASGSSTNPKQLPESHYWVVTNNNTGKKVTMLQEVVRVLGYSDADSQKLTALLDPSSVVSE
ncbi:replication initiation negative regulator SeqA [Lacimicrobium alkaliphilum]|uniref:Negative modulator of initiation of replication n=1 Tax=Lacimicrobium alkaliphilum TaxID=1526571 RepID=A0ABQ1R345_9ALTE|nr:replication initiation negative regulator SeqA [Lacimicrobium alkaliphilum]GGD53993.1 negative modulator of initiation of replication [Lacimicrobium alkaliphilum]